MSNQICRSYHKYFLIWNGGAPKKQKRLLLWETCFQISQQCLCDIRYSEKTWEQIVAKDNTFNWHSVSSALRKRYYEALLASLKRLKHQINHSCHQETLWWAIHDYQHCNTWSVYQTISLTTRYSDTLLIYFKQAIYSLTVELPKVCHPPKLVFFNYSLQDEGLQPTNWPHMKANLLVTQVESALFPW